MTSSAVIILALCFIQGSLALPQSPIVGISGGHAVNIGDARFMAALLRIDNKTNAILFLCGGSIVHPKFVLTAAICSKIGKLTVRVGSSRYDKGGDLHQVEKYIIHESYSDVNQNYKNNVALLKLSKPVTMGLTVALIKLLNSPDIREGLPANFTGWGITTQHSQEVSRNLLQVSVTVSPLVDCINHFHYSLTDENNICVNNGAKGACYFDFGAPLTVGVYQIGLLSYGFSCWNQQPNVYEKVEPHIEWIKNKIRQNL